MFSEANIPCADSSVSFQSDIQALQRVATILGGQARDGTNLTLNVQQLAETNRALQTGFETLQGDPGRNGQVEQDLPRLVRQPRKRSPVPVTAADGSDIASADGSTIVVMVDHGTTST